MRSIGFFCGVAENAWSRYPTMPGPLTCISPIYGIGEKKDASRPRLGCLTRVLQDSGAFCDGPHERLTSLEALRRQERHAAFYNYQHLILRRASYDRLVDELWSYNAQGLLVRRKGRMAPELGQEAVEETVAAARFLHQHRNGVSCVLSLQGVTPEQYLECAQRVVPFYREGDQIGLGGFCILGKFPAQMMPDFRDKLRLVMPFLASAGVRSVHLWGVCYLPALVELLWWCERLGTLATTDSVGPSTKPNVYHEWGYMGWSDRTYEAPPLVWPHEEHLAPLSVVYGYDGREIVVPYTLGAHRQVHVEETRSWIGQVGETPMYRALAAKRRGMSIEELIKNYHRLAQTQQLSLAI